MGRRRITVSAMGWRWIMGDDDVADAAVLVERLGGDFG